jgi:histone acetyltransferase
MKVLYPASHLISDLDDAKICVKIARHSVCATCKSCVGMHPSLGVTVTLDDEDVDHMLASAIDSDDDTTPEYLDACACGHGVGAHGVDQARALGPVEFRRRAMVAIRLDEELQVRGTLGYSCNMVLL